MDEFHQGIKRRLTHDTDKLREHCKQTTESRLTSSNILSTVVSPSEQFSARLAEWKQDIAQERLIKKPVDLRGKILPTEGSEGVDPATRKLLEAHEAFHAEKLPLAVSVVAKQVADSQVGKRTVDKHKVVLGVTQGSRHRGHALV